MNQKYKRAQEVQKSAWIWAQSYHPDQLQNIQQIHFLILDKYEKETQYKYILSEVISFLRFIFSHTHPNIPFVSTHQMIPSPHILYVFLNHPELHRAIPQLPPIFVLFNTLDHHNSSFIFPENILLYSKAYKIIDCKYKNLSFYIPEVRKKRYYLPWIHSHGTHVTPSSSKNSSPKKILFYMYHGKRSALLSQLIIQRFEEKYKDHHYEFCFYDPMNEELFEECDIVLRLYDEPNPYYDNILFSKCMKYQKVCISEKCDDIYHENYYFDKVLFEKLDLITLIPFVDKIHLYLTNDTKIKQLQYAMKENVERNILQAKHIFN